MKARWMIPLAVCMAVLLLAQVGMAASPAPPAPNQGQVQQTPATLVSAPGMPAPCPQVPPCPCFVPQPICGAAPWWWQHDDQNDNNWPADHGG